MSAWKGTGDVVSSGIGMNIHHFSGKVEIVDYFGFHRFRIDFFEWNSAGGNECFFDRKTSIYFESKIFDVCDDAL